MGQAPSTRQNAEDKYYTRIEQEMIRAVTPHGLQDEKAKELKYQLHWCLSKNDWYFTAGERMLTHSRHAGRPYGKLGNAHPFSREP